MQPGTDKLLAKAARAAAAAEGASAAGAADAAAGRAYYAMLYAAKALLNERGLRPRSHAGVVSELERGPARIDATQRGWLAAALERRQKAGEGALELAPSDVEEMVAQARAFVAAAAAAVRAGAVA